MAYERCIAFDLLCQKCKYNLRGLPAGTRCPECGEPAPKDVVTPDDWLHWSHTSHFEPVASASGSTVDAVAFVFDSLRHARQTGPRTMLGGLPPVGAQDVCRALRDLALEYFSDEAEALDLLSEWGI